MGDPAGVGPELCLRLLADPAVRAFCSPVAYGDLGVLERVAKQLGWPQPDPADINDLGAITAGAFTPGRVTAACGRAAHIYFITAIADACAGAVDAITTAPLNKEALRAAGISEPGHTEVLANMLNAERSCMMLTADEITCSLVTVHIGYREVPNLLTVPRILDTIELTAAAMERLRGRPPKLLVCGLNPHAGEHGLFGNREEERIILPAIEAARGKGIDVAGPLPPDTAFLPKYRRACDAYVCMYHDQGLIPLKALVFEDAVNVTLGLPIVRTSVDHGTAFDIAWRGVADVSSLVQAVKLAARLAS
ncbi:MAG: 4-hydroxythreonine-4-phosphate dehydrogenase PdxA [Gemmataceae bacterium]|nr:4-hydroxythreonine-4-phosphate dehydrogenase PdxA [Gemmataceae bacterium]